MKPRDRHWTALIFLTLLANVVLFYHKPLFHSEYIFPWDFRGVQLPMLTFLAGELRSGRFALWDPFSYCGVPVFANIESCYFNPFILLSVLVASHLPAWALPMVVEWVVVLHVWMAGVCLYYLLREIGTGRAASWTGAIMFQTGGYFASRTEHIAAVMSASWMPLAWLAVWKLRERFRPGWLAILAAALGLSVLGGFPATTLAVFVSTALLSVLLAALRLAHPRAVGHTAAGCLLGLLLGAAQLLPTNQLAHRSVAMYRAGWLGGGGGLNWQSLVSLVLPNYYGIFDTRTFHGPGDITFLYLYMSLAGLGLAIYCLVVRRTRTAAALGLMAAFGTIWMLGEKTAIWRATYFLIPEQVRIGIHPEYTYCIFTICVAALAALGLQALRVPERVRVCIGLAIAVDLFLVGSGRPMNVSSRKAEPGVTNDAFGGNRALLSEVRRYVGETTPPWRVDVMDAPLEWSAQAAITRVPTASGISPLALESAIQLRLFLHDGNPGGWYYPVEKLDSPVLDLMNVKYLLAGPASAGSVRWPPRFRHVESLPGVELYENRTVMPRYFLVHEARAVSSLAEARSLIEHGQIDLRRTAITDRPVVLPGAIPSGAGGVDVERYRPASLELRVRTDTEALLVLCENNYPGWKAWLDSVPVPVHTVDLSFRGVVVPPGEHRLRMRFEPDILPVSIAITAATATGLIALVCFGMRRARRQEKARASALGCGQD